MFSYLPKIAMESPQRIPLKDSPSDMTVSKLKAFPAPCVMGDESIMAPKKHGTSNVPVQQNLRWGCDRETADRICNYNRSFTEFSGYYEKTTFIKDLFECKDKAMNFYDSNTGKLLFTAPKGRTLKEFLMDTCAHGWPSFRDQEVNWDNVRVLPKTGEVVSIDGTHLGQNLPDRNGSRYMINLVSVAGNPVEEAEAVEQDEKQ